MAPAVPMQHKVRLPENEELARSLHEKRLSMREQPGGLKENLDLTFAKAYRNVYAAKEPIRTLKEFSKVKGVGPWLIRCMKGFFAESRQDLSPTKGIVVGKKTRGPKCHLPKKNPAASGPPGKGPPTSFGLSDCSVSIYPFSSQGAFEVQSSGTMGSAEFNIPHKDTVYIDSSILAMPPRQSGEEFLEAYEVVLILDDRENFGKNVADLSSSIKDNRYKDQKSRLQKCGLRKLIYLVEGDPNDSKGSVASIKTACFTTEILEGFDVLRTSGYTDTENTYGYLTLSIIEYYSTNFLNLAKSSRVCPTYEEFGGKCRGLQKKTVSQIFALQLMQVPQVTEKAALAVVEFYPTLLSLARAYFMLEGDICAQEEMLKNKSKMINAGASRNIFKLVWGDGCNLQI
ncbi:crossover junction endonuclease MUS81-like isoform X4 [Phragmites australis]|uniref:crossover junction endonuclease MUS81-like isoform X4 n=1 Tax=Phragmites australis TaxID=29695 RepID=UPI002D77E846|nr:crossover junction endonuclease MUS81-like isoform X4 [Phragmites australis]